MKKNIVLRILIFSIFFFIALNIVPANIFAKTIDVYVSVYPVYDITSAIAADRANVHLTVPSGTEIHGYEPSPKKIAAIEKADVFFYIGQGLESWAEKIVKNLENLDIQTVKLSEGLELVKYDNLEHNHEDDKDESVQKNEAHHHEDDAHNHSEEEHDIHETEAHTHGQYDPHVWLNPMNMKEMARVVKEKLISMDTDNKEFYQENYQEYVKRLNNLDMEYKETLAEKDSNYILVSHAAFGYLGDRYGFKQLSVSGLSSHAEPSPGNLAKLLREVKEHEIKYIFKETLANPRLVEVVAQEANLEILVLNPIGGLMVDEEKRGEDYFSIMKENLKNLKKALVN
ncbi:MAG: metal ABC transporter solute-binding protein, Zn/Mn family [Halanaerobiales bacterium]